jgi:L-ribulose-5-phosphate 3-epimerase
MKVGIMQGRLSHSETGALQEFPRHGWEAEFARAAAAGFDSIQWLYDVHGEGANPIETHSGIERMWELVDAYGVDVQSLCAHYLIQRPDDVERLEWLVDRCRLAGIEQVVLPFLEGAEYDPALVERLRIPEVELLVEGVPDAPAVNHDTGNDPLEAIGPNVRGVHVKDRDRDGNNVPLGEGVVDIGTALAMLRAFGYAGEYVLETPRPRGDVLDWGRAQLSYVKRVALAEIWP